MTTKAAVNAIIKEFNPQFVKVSNGDYYSSPKCYTGLDGKRVKGIPSGSVGPMTVTNVAVEKGEEIISRIKQRLSQIGLRQCELNPGVMVGGKNDKLRLLISLDNFPQYTRDAGYDEMYRNLFVTTRWV